MPYKIIQRPSGRYFIKNTVTGDVLTTGYDSLAEAKIARAKLRRGIARKKGLFGSGF